MWTQGKSKMKYLLLSILLLSACGVGDFYNLIGIRKFKVGDCLVVAIHDPESWQKRESPTYKVTEIGKRSYRIMYIASGPSDIYDDISFGHLWEDFYQKVDCK